MVTTDQYIHIRMPELKPVSMAVAALLKRIRPTANKKNSMIFNIAPKFFANVSAILTKRYNQPDMIHQLVVFFIKKYTYHGFTFMHDDRK